MGKPLVSIVMGSANDWEVMQQAAQQLKDFGIAYDARVISAHRSPDLLFDYIRDMTDRGVRCFIAGAGAAAHLAGVVAGQDHAAGAGRADAVEISAGHGFAVVHRANAQGHPGGDLRHRRSGCRQCGIVRGGHAGAE